MPRGRGRPCFSLKLGHTERSPTDAILRPIGLRREIPMRRLLVFVALCFSLPAQAVTIDWVTVGAPGVAADCV